MQPNQQERKELYKDNFADYLLCLALDIGEGMLKNGAEINRVESTIERICYAYGASHVECFSIISMIQAAVRMPDGTYSTQLRRVRSNTVNLHTLESLNALSREVCQTTPPLAEVEARIREVKKTHPYNRTVRMIASGITTGAFCLFFGGTLLDSLIATLIGLLVFNIESTSLRVNPLVRTLFSSVVITLLVGASVRLGIGQNPEAIIAGSIMIIVPGVAFCTAMQDLLDGDLLAGSLKTVQACLCALMIGFGYVVGGALIGGAYV